MLKTFSTLCAVVALSAGFVATSATAECRSNTAAATGVGAIGGGVIGAGLSHGSAGGVIGGAIVGALIGNSIARDDCSDRRSDSYYHDHAQYGSMNDGSYESWRNPNTGAYGDFRVTRTYYQNGYWDGSNWNVSQDEYGHDARYVRTNCRDYTETVNDNGRHSIDHTACRAEDGSGWRVVR